MRNKTIKFSYSDAHKRIKEQIRFAFVEELPVFCEELNMMIRKGKNSIFFTENGFHKFYLPFNQIK